MRETLLVVGATGSIGLHVVAQALNDGYRVRALVRNADKRALFPPAAEVVVGDLSADLPLHEAIEGVDCVVFTHGTYGRPDLAELVDYGMVRNLLRCLNGRSVRIALMSTVGATDRKGSHDWKRRGERLVRASGLAYTIVRPGWFDYNEPNERKLVLLQGDKRQSGTPKDGVIARDQLAKVLVSSLRSAGALRKTFELAAEVGQEQPDFEVLFDQLDRDTDGMLDGRHDLANMPLEHEPEKILADLRGVKAGSFE
ncbi:MAG: SDR family oxidoreductase [Pararhizobium sp.]